MVSKAIHRMDIVSHPWVMWIWIREIFILLHLIVSLTFVYAAIYHLLERKGARNCCSCGYSTADSAGN